MTQERIKILDLLWKNGLNAEMIYEDNPKPDKQLKKALTDNIPLIIWIGENELKEQSVKVKKLKENSEELVKISDMCQYLKTFLGK